jgi:hypothetical protein
MYEQTMARYDAEFYGYACAGALPPVTLPSVMLMLMLSSTLRARAGT